MTARERQEQVEAMVLCEQAVRSADTRGRQRPITPCDLRTEFQRDRDRVLHCKAFRRLKHKTQVFLAPEGDHYRTRLTHTLEVSQIARTIARALRLNEDLTEAIALGHDLGHTPFGHMGERTLSRLMPGGFRHTEHSLRVVDLLEGEGGLNLTYEVRDGICHHSGDVEAETCEGRIVHVADRIAYINHDIDDALRAGFFHERELPRGALAVAGDTHGKRIDAMIRDVVAVGEKRGRIGMSEHMQSATDALREFLIRRVYQSEWAQSQESKADHILTGLFDYFIKHPATMPNECLETAYRESVERAVCDHIASMTDRYAARLYEKLFVPEAFVVY